MGYRRRTSIALTTALMLGSAPAALADTRIFSARASLPDVTIDQAFRNGDELAVVGQGNDGATLFRIDSPSTPVGCANRIEFVASTGQRVEQVADMCVLNWDVTVEVEAIEVVDDFTVEKDDDIPLPPADSTFTQSVTVATDDPAVTIISVSLDGDPVSITGREEGTVFFEVAGTDEGIVCDREVGLTLSNGSTVASDENICLNDWNVLVALDDNGTDSNTPPPPPDVATPTEPPPPSATTIAAPSNPDMTWIFSSFDDGATLIRGIPETDATEFFANCERRSGVISVTLTDSGVVGLAPGSAIPIRFTAGSFSKTYSGSGSTMDDLAGVSLPEVAIPTSDPLWSAIIREQTLEAAAGGWRMVMSLKGSAGPARQLLAACSQTPPPASPPSGPPAGPGIVANFFCDNGSAISVTFNGAQQTAIVIEAGAPPLTLRFEPGRKNARYSAGPARLVLHDDSMARFSRFGGPAATCQVQ